MRSSSAAGAELLEGRVRQDDGVRRGDPGLPGDDLAFGLSQASRQAPGVEPT